MSVSSETTTRVITLSVTGTDAKETAKVAKAMASSVSTVAQNVGAAQSINVIDEVKTPEAPSGPKRMLYVAVAFLAGIFIAVAYVVLADMLNTASAVQKRQKSSWVFRCWPNSGYERW